MPEDFTHALCSVDSEFSGSDSCPDHSDSEDNTSDLKELQEWHQIILLSTLPQNHKRAVENNPNMILDNNIAAQAKKNFGHVFSNVVGAERPNILKPVKDNVQQLFMHLGLGSNEDMKVLLKMHPGSVGTCYTPLSLILFPKPDALVARDLFKSQLLVNIIHVMVFGKGVLMGKRRGGPQGRGQKLGISGALAGLITITATFPWYNKHGTYY
ncbi:hypothetical protein F5J12DRAFT_784506 [Pisolithus orientalis]|uniref:uncharacterized protein n=1 Tax=Pisolithus orientalis TaxID=936130 RepID=UPI00222539FE|nr:uncharacterized protein F5J12DRAFT_784506 [Pisolithus orientalis]KAI6000202.1 hypothetical protein F5J12DRAFT_784506 [Pisolithus orientalis]